MLISSRTGDWDDYLSPLPLRAEERLGIRLATDASHMMENDCETAFESRRFSLGDRMKRKDADGDQHFGMVDTTSASPSRDGGGNRRTWLHQFQQAACYAHAERRCSRHLGHGHAIRGPTRGARVAGHEGRRGCRLRGCWCPSYQLGHHRWDIQHDHPFPLGNGYGSRTQ
jgi:hypothetical protein